jgi:hypothetical protein
MLAAALIRPQLQFNYEGVMPSDNLSRGQSGHIAELPRRIFTRSLNRKIARISGRIMLAAAFLFGQSALSGDRIENWQNFGMFSSAFAAGKGSQNGRAHGNGRGNQGADGAGFGLSNMGGAMSVPPGQACFHGGSSSRGTSVEAHSNTLSPDETLPEFVLDQKPMIDGLQKLRDAKLDRLQTVVEQDPIVGGSLSLAEYIKRMNRVMNEDRPEMEVIPDSQDLVAQYLLLYSFSGDPDDFDEIVDYDYQHANLTIFLRSDSTQDIERVVGLVQDFAVREFGYAGDNDTAATVAQDPWSIRFGRWLAGIEPTVIGWETNSGFRLGIAGNGYLTTRFSELVVSGQLASLVVSLVAVFLLTAFLCRSWVAGLSNIVPFRLGMVFSFGLLGLLGIPLEVGKSLTASMVIGIGIDYTIHFLNKYRIKVRAGLTDPEEITAATMATSGKAIFFNALVVTASFLVFLTSNFRPNFYLGAMLSLNMGACLLVSMTVLPAILNTFRPRFVFGEEEAAVMKDAA